MFDPCPVIDIDLEFGESEAPICELSKRVHKIHNPLKASWSLHIVKRNPSKYGRRNRKASTTANPSQLIIS